LAGEQLPPLPNIAQLNRIQPLVEVLNVVPQPESPDRVTVTVKVSGVDGTGEECEAQDLRVFRNGQLVAIQEGPILAKSQIATFTFPNIRLPHNTSKDYVFTAYAFNADRVKSQTATREFRPQKRLGGQPQNGFVVAIGVNKTTNAAWDLNFAAGDAFRIGAVLADRLRTTLSNVHLDTLISDDRQPNGATKRAIRERISRIATEATPDDALFISFSGHGYADPNGRFYLFPSDLNAGEQTARSELLTSAISGDELAEWLRPVDAGEMTIIIDACHSAASVSGDGYKPGPMGSRGLGQLAYDKRIRILAATQLANAALESDQLKQGLLTYALVHDGLESAQADWQPKDGKITIAEWLNYAVDRVPKLYEEVRYGGRRGALLMEPPSQNQLPALFDFTRANAGLVLQQIQ
jgi:hypothetical protein